MHCPEDKRGLVVGRSCIDNLFTLQQLMEKQVMKSRETHHLFIDIKEAYDNVPHQSCTERECATNVSQMLWKNCTQITKV